MLTSLGSISFHTSSPTFAGTVPATTIDVKPSSPLKQPFSSSVMVIGRFITVIFEQPSNAPAAIFDVFACGVNSPLVDGAT